MALGDSAQHVVRYTEEDFAGLRAAGRLAAQTLDMITPYVVPGALTADLDATIHQFTLDHHAVPAP